MKTPYHLTKKFSALLISIFCIITSITSRAESEPHPTAIQSNNFAHSLVKLSNHLIKQQTIITKKSLGGYGGLTNDLEFYKETINILEANNQVISNIRWEKNHPDNLHGVEVNIYDEKGRLKRDYSASYLPFQRRAPYQTLINLHYYNKNLHSFRQFDALDNILYQQCEGTLNNKPVAIEFDYFEIPDSLDEIKNKTLRQAYHACFKNAATTAAPYTNPLIEITQKRVALD